MWLFLNDAFLSVVKPRGLKTQELLVRARRKGDIERVFGYNHKRIKVERTPQRDYLYRALIPSRTVANVIAANISQINYDNFKDSVFEDERHDAYAAVWGCMNDFQRGIYEQRRKKRFENVTRSFDWSLGDHYGEDLQYHIDAIRRRTAESESEGGA